MPPREPLSIIARTAREGFCGDPCAASSGIDFGPSPRPLDDAAASLRFAASLAGRATWFRRYASRRRMARRRDERPQPRERLFAVAGLTPVILREDDDFSGRVQTPARDALQPRAHSMRQVCLCEVQAQFHRCRDLVDVLSPRSRCADELDRQGVVRHPHLSCYLNHCH